MELVELGSLIASICSEDPEVSNVFRDGIILDKTFAELGINSIKALELAALIEERLGVQFPDSELSGVVDFRGFAELLQRSIRTKGE